MLLTYSFLAVEGLYFLEVAQYVLKQTNSEYAVCLFREELNILAKFGWTFVRNILAKCGWRFF